MKPPLIIDNFAGGGGASTCIERALGRAVDVTINHDAEAVAMHLANQPTTKHYCQSIMAVDPLEATGGAPVALAWDQPRVRDKAYTSMGIASFWKVCGRKRRSGREMRKRCRSEGSISRTRVTATRRDPSNRISASSKSPVADLPAKRTRVALSFHGISTRRRLLVYRNTIGRSRRPYPQSMCVFGWAA